MRFDYTARHEELRFDITPLIDVVFLLIIFFMVTSSFAHITSIKVNLPSIATGTQLTEKSEFIVFVEADGVYVVDDVRQRLSQIENYFSKAPHGMRISIYADENVSVKHVMAIWDLARKYNYKEIIVGTQSEEGK